MSWRITPTQPIPAVIGEPFGGGYFAGYISHTANGVPTHALIVAPRATGVSGNLQWKTAGTTTAGTTSSFDGAANTAAMVTAGIADHPAANFCVGLSIGGYSDWYLPARYELDIAYFNLKPSTVANNTSWGSNIYSVPRRPLNNTLLFPRQTLLTAFNTTAEAFTDQFWTSSEFKFDNGWRFLFVLGGDQGALAKINNSIPARAFRRIAL